MAESPPMVAQNFIAGRWVDAQRGGRLPSLNPATGSVIGTAADGHREGGRQVLDVFSEWKSVYIDYSGRLQRAQIDRD